MGLAPTTSTTMMLALGDAVAVALLERHQFSPTDFHTLHPGGKLGKKLLKVSDIMHGNDELPLIAPDVPMNTIFRGIWPFWFAMGLCLAILVALPELALFLPNTMYD